MPGSRLSEAEINELIRAYVKQAIEDAELYRATSKKRLNSDTVDEELDLIGSLKAEFRESLAYRDFGVVKPSVDSLLKENNIELDEESDEYRQLSHQMLKAQIFLSDIDKKQALGDYTYQDQDFLTPSPSQPGVSPQVQPSETLGKIVEAYWAENSGRWKQRSVVEFKVFKKSLLDFLKPDTQIHAITYETGRNYKESLKKKKNQGGHPLSDSRINNYLSFASTLFRWAKRQHLTELNPFEGLQIAGTKKRVDQLRDVFSKADLEKMFCTSNEYGKDAHIHAHNFWVPLLGLFTGMRLEEICQGYVSDIKLFDGVWCFDINDDRSDKSVKTEDRRLVPLHPVLVEELAFIKYVQSLPQDGRIFPSLKMINYRYGHNIGRWFADFKKRSGVEAPPGKKSFHSFRHTVTNYLKQNGVPVQMIAELVGHKAESITMERYGKRYEPKKLYEGAVVKIDYGLDLSHLKKSKYIPS